MIDVAVIVNALRALRPAQRRRSRTLPVATGQRLHHDHLTLGRSLDRLRAIADTLDDATPETAAKLIEESTPSCSSKWSRMNAMTRARSIPH